VYHLRSSEKLLIICMLLIIGIIHYCLIGVTVSYAITINLKPIKVTKIDGIKYKIDVNCGNHHDYELGDKFNITWGGQKIGQGSINRFNLYDGTLSIKFKSNILKSLGLENIALFKVVPINKSVTENKATIKIKEAMEKHWSSGEYEKSILYIKDLSEEIKKMPWVIDELNKLAIAIEKTKEIEKALKASELKQAENILENVKNILPRNKIKFYQSKITYLSNVNKEKELESTKRTLMQLWKSGNLSKLKVLLASIEKKHLQGIWLEELKAKILVASEHIHKIEGFIKSNKINAAINYLNRLKNGDESQLPIIKYMYYKEKLYQLAELENIVKKRIYFKNKIKNYWERNEFIKIGTMIQKMPRLLKNEDWVQDELRKVKSTIEFIKYFEELYDAGDIVELQRKIEEMRRYNDRNIPDEILVHYYYKIKNLISEKEKRKDKIRNIKIIADDYWESGRLVELKKLFNDISEDTKYQKWFVRRREQLELALNKINEIEEKIKLKQIEKVSFLLDGITNGSNIEIPKIIMESLKNKLNELIILNKQHKILGNVKTQIASYWNSGRLREIQNTINNMPSIIDKPQWLALAELRLSSAFAYQSQIENALRKEDLDTAGYLLDRIIISHYRDLPKVLIDRYKKKLSKLTENKEARLRDELIARKLIQVRKLLSDLNWALIEDILRNEDILKAPTNEQLKNLYKLANYRLRKYLNARNKLVDERYYDVKSMKNIEDDIQFLIDNNTFSETLNRISEAGMEFIGAGDKRNAKMMMSIHLSLVRLKLAPHTERALSAIDTGNLPDAIDAIKRAERIAIKSKNIIAIKYVNEIKKRINSRKLQSYNY
jgi:hypothetical protein